VRQHGSSSNSFRLGPILTCDPAAEQFTGEFAEQANSKLRRDIRSPFVFPEYLANS
jgi:hypothetical protein